jgi:hypothetical protein
VRASPFFETVFANCPAVFSSAASIGSFENTRLRGWGLQTALFLTIIAQTASTITAPMTAPTRPAPSPGP